MKQKMFKQLAVVTAAAIAAATSSTAAMAAVTPPDFSSLTSGVDFTTVIAGMLAVGALLAMVFVAKRGIGLLLGAIKGR